jgi:hypothetical protein
MNRVFYVKFLDSNDDVRTFIQAGKDLDDATNVMCTKLEDHIANAKKDLMHLETVEII